MTNTTLLKAYGHLLAPDARLLQRSGITSAEYAEIGKEVFVDVAGLEEIDAWLDKHQVNETDFSKSENVRLGAGVYLLHDET